MCAERIKTSNQHTHMQKAEMVKKLVGEWLNGILNQNFIVFRFMLSHLAAQSVTQVIEVGSDSTSCHA